jgi:hypothetical protein
MVYRFTDIQSLPAAFESSHPNGLTVEGADVIVKIETFRVVRRSPPSSPARRRPVLAS